MSSLLLHISSSFINVLKLVSLDSDHYKETLIIYLAVSP